MLAVTLETGRSASVEFVFTDYPGDMDFNIRGHLFHSDRHLYKTESTGHDTLNY